MKLEVKGIQQTIANLQRISRGIKKGSGDTLREVANVGQEFALNVAPEFTGALKSNIFVFEENPEAWVILSRTPPSDFGFPVPALFETGDYPNVTGNEPRDPNSLFFMQQTANFLEQEFANRLNIKIERVIR